MQTELWEANIIIHLILRHSQKPIIFMENLDPKWRYKNVQDYSEDGKTRFYINPDYYQEFLEKEKKQ